LENPRLGFAMNEMKRRIGRREAVRTAIFGALAILTGCGAESTTKARSIGAANRKNKKRQAMLARLRSGYPALPPSAAIRRMEKGAAKKFAM
jgi:hypothetical protein